MAAGPETLDDLIYAAGLSFGEVAARAGIDAKALFNLRTGTVKRKARPTTVAGLAKALGVTPARVRAAIEASRTAAES